MTHRRLDFFDALARPLRERIRTGELRHGDLLPSESDLARAAGTKRYSVRKALALLREEGLIEAVPGRGWAVVDPHPAAGGRGTLPRYQEIAAELRDTITKLHLPPGTCLPSEAELTARFAVSRATVRQALALLQMDGLITVRPGKGRYVAGD